MSEGVPEGSECEGVPAGFEADLEEMQEKFRAKINKFTEDVKERMMSAPTSKAATKYFETAALFLTQVFPDIDDEDTIATYVKKRAEKKEMEKGLEPAKDSSGLFCAPPSISSGSMSGEPPQALTQKREFSAKVPGDAKASNFWDIKLLPSGLILISDCGNSCMKMFNSLGQHLHSLKMEKPPRFFTVMNILAAERWDIAVTLSGNSTVVFLEVTLQGFRVKKSVPTAKSYCAIEAINPDMLFVYPKTNRGDESPVEIINLEGRVLLECQGSVSCYRMAVSADLHVLCSTWNNSISKFNIEDGSFEYNHRVRRVARPKGLACLRKGYVIVADGENRTLHLVNGEGVWVRQLWAHPGGKDSQAVLCSVSVLNNTCVCCTSEGYVFVLELSY